mmetsp:Transcript_51077/g.136252  ORF Transcript_51077/g.136252 Transcript_51077/m.136252 type:complete len:232 (-) Transcript_51077:6-701(-)
MLAKEFTSQCKHAPLQITIFSGLPIFRDARSQNMWVEMRRSLIILPLSEAFYIVQLQTYLPERLIVLALGPGSLKSFDLPQPGTPHANDTPVQTCNNITETTKKRLNGKNDPKCHQLPCKGIGSKSENSKPQRRASELKERALQPLHLNIHCQAKLAPIVLEPKWLHQLEEFTAKTSRGRRLWRSLSCSLSGSVLKQRPDRESGTTQPDKLTTSWPSSLPFSASIRATFIS